MKTLQSSGGHLDRLYLTNWKMNGITIGKQLSSHNWLYLPYAKIRLGVGKAVVAIVQDSAFLRIL